MIVVDCTHFWFLGYSLARSSYPSRFHDEDFNFRAMFAHRSLLTALRSSISSSVSLVSSIGGKGSNLIVVSGTLSTLDSLESLIHRRARRSLQAGSRRIPRVTALSFTFSSRAFQNRDHKENLRMCISSRGSITTVSCVSRGHEQHNSRTRIVIPVYHWTRDR